ncbi:unnamed protein product [Heterobilharzia americana]|nr:unnamed protein product [Heterobilharzia americana]
MASIMSHEYKTLWDQQALEHNKNRMTQLARSQIDILHPLDSVASVLNIVPIQWNATSRQQKNRISNKGLWKLSRFTKQKKCIDTRWSEEDAERLLGQR